jgi:hypothetical protein
MLFVFRITRIKEEVIVETVKPAASHLGKSEKSGRR